jgi:hypothetical protein
LFQRFIDPGDIESDNGDRNGMSVCACGIIKQWIGVIGLWLCELKGIETNMGIKLDAAFRAAGLPAPSMHMEAVEWRSTPLIRTQRIARSLPRRSGCISHARSSTIFVIVRPLGHGIAGRPCPTREFEASMVSYPANLPRDLAMAFDGDHANVFVFRDLRSSGRSRPAQSSVVE